MALWVKKNKTTWVEAKAVFIKKDKNTWAAVKNMFIKSSPSLWKIFFTSSTVPQIETKVTVSKTTNPSDGLITLTGTNYHWSDVTPGTLSLKYWFERSDGTIIGTKNTATNPPSGSSVQYTQVVYSSSMLKNADTDLQFVVECTNTTTSQPNNSVSDPVTFNGARDISNLSAGTATYTSIPLTFTPGAYSSSFLVSYSYSGGNVQYLSSAGTGSTTKTITVSNLLASRQYSFTVTPYSGGIVGGTVTGYQGNESSPVIKSTLTAISPTQTSSPTIPSGTGEYNTSVAKGSSGVYTNGTYISITTRLVGVTSSNPVPTNGSTSEEGVSVLSPFTVTQGAATSPKTIFYTRDDVLGVDGSTIYYYYSPGLSSYIASIEDNFNRANGQITYTSNGLNYNSTYSSFSSSWYTTSNKAWSSQAVSSNTTTNPKMVIESGGKVNITGSIQYPETTSAGYGLAFWSTSAGSWWSVSPNCLTATSTVCGTTYTTGLTSCPATGSNVGDYCGTCVSYTETISTCTGITNYPGVTTCPAGSCSCTDLAATSPTCSVSVTGALTCPASGTGAGDRCTACSSVCNGADVESTTGALDSFCGGICQCTGPFTRTTYGCGTIQYGSTCPPTSTTTYNATTVGVRCSDCTRIDLATLSWKVVTATTSTYYNCKKSTCSYTKYSNGTAAGKTYGTAGTQDVTRYKSYKNVSQTNYNTYLQIYSSNGSTVTSKASQLIDSNATGYIDLYLIGVTTNNGLITAKAYSGITTQVGTDLTYTRQISDPAMSLSNGTSAHGMIKMYTAANEASYVDNLLIYLDS